MTLKLKHEELVDFNLRSKKMLRTYWIFISIIILTEFVIFLLLVKNDVLNNPEDEYFNSYTKYFTDKLLIPTFINGTTMLAATICVELFRRLKKYFFQALTLQISITIIAYIITYIHSSVSGIYMSFTFPIILALIYIDKKPIIFSSVLSLGGYLTAYFVFLKDLDIQGKIRHGFMETASTIAFFIISFFISFEILKRQEELVKNITEEKQKSRIDSLTGFMNHASFYEMLDIKIKEFRDVQKTTGNAIPLSIIVWDIDNFKNVNDTYGHSAGDTVILALVDSICMHIGDKDMAFRYGGEEFTLISSRRKEELFDIAEKIRTDFISRSKTDCFPKGTTISGGICTMVENDFFGRREFFSAADEALYKAKRNGKNMTVIYQNESKNIDVDVSNK